MSDLHVSSAGLIGSTQSYILWFCTHTARCGPDMVSSWHGWHGKQFFYQIRARSGIDATTDQVVVFTLCGQNPSMSQLAQVWFGLLCATICQCHNGQVVVRLTWPWFDNATRGPAVVWFTVRSPNLLVPQLAQMWSGFLLVAQISQCPKWPICGLVYMAQIW